jgi:transcription initiation factor IIE alpha subunit
VRTVVAGKEGNQEEEPIALAQDERIATKLLRRGVTPSDLLVKLIELVAGHDSTYEELAKQVNLPEKDVRDLLDRFQDTVFVYSEGRYSLANDFYT